MGPYEGLLAITSEQTSSQPRMKQIVVYTLANVTSTAQDHLKNQDIINIPFSIDPLSRVHNYAIHRGTRAVSVKCDRDKYYCSES